MVFSCCLLILKVTWKFGWESVLVKFHAEQLSVLISLKLAPGVGFEPASTEVDGLERNYRVNSYMNLPPEKYDCDFIDRAQESIE